MGEPVWLWGQHAGQRQPTAVQVAQIVRKSVTGKGGAEEVHPLEASRALKGVSAHIKVTDGAGVPGARMVTDGARVRMNIATNKEQSRDKDTSKGGTVN